MKKILIIVLSIIIIIGLVAGGLFLFKTSTPEYALAKTIKDVKSSGMSGLKNHLTEEAIEQVETIEDWTETLGVSGILSAITQDSAVSFLKAQIAEVEWTVVDVLSGKDRADVVIGFDYNNSIVGTIEITMIREGRDWKIDGLSFPCFSRLSLW